MLLKNEIRKNISQMREMMTKKQIKELNDSFVHHFHSINFLKNIKNQIIAGYYPFNLECNILPILEYYSKNNKICLPVIENKFEKMIFKKWNLNANELEKNKLFKKQNLFEPIKSSQILTPTIVFMPAIAIDIFGNRIGYGAGYYDKTLQNLNCIKIATIFNFQLFNTEFEHYKNDIKVDYILTENKFMQI